MKKAYIYPITAFADKTIPNPYLENLMSSLEPDFNFLNRKKPSSTGIFDLIHYYKEIDCIFLNWIEDLPDKKGGWLQGLFFIGMVCVMKSRKIRIIWTLHNKLSHYKTNYRFKKFLFRFVLRKSDYVITHSREGISYANEYKVKKPEKIRYFPHPLEKKFLSFNGNPGFDILIWGSIIPYKGIDRFLQYLHDNNLQHNYKISIVGKVKPEEYREVMLKLCNEKIQLDDRYVPEEDIKKAVADSKTVVFTYMGNSVLSSGVLMDTLSYGGTVLAPRVGAFKDAEEEGLIKTFDGFDELISLIDKELSCKEKRMEIITKFIEDNNWERFSKRIINWIN